MFKTSIAQVALCTCNVKIWSPNIGTRLSIAYYKYTTKVESIYNNNNAVHNVDVL